MSYVESPEDSLKHYGNRNRRYDERNEDDRGLRSRYDEANEGDRGVRSHYTDYPLKGRDDPPRRFPDSNGNAKHIYGNVNNSYNATGDSYRDIRRDNSDLSNGSERPNGVKPTRESTFTESNGDAKIREKVYQVRY